MALMFSAGVDWGLSLGLGTLSYLSQEQSGVRCRSVLKNEDGSSSPPIFPVVIVSYHASLGEKEGH